jgi:diadenosine tetraphosphatase ApaH/serine/threonine PP2A family protein phosphatase
LLCDLLWAQPNDSLEEWEDSDQGVSYDFGVKVLENFMNRNKFTKLVRTSVVSMKEVKEKIVSKL